MAWCSFPLPHKPLPPISPSPIFSPSPSLLLPIVHSKDHLLTRLNSHVLDSHVSLESIIKPPKKYPESDPSSVPNNTKTKSRKKRMNPRPNFYEQTIQRWSAKISSQRSRFPWQEQQHRDEEDDEEKVEEEKEGCFDSGIHLESSSSSSSHGRFVSVGKAESTKLRSHPRLNLIVERMNASMDANDSEQEEENGDVNEGPLSDRNSGAMSVGRRVVAPWDHGVKTREANLDSINGNWMTPYESGVLEEVEEDETSSMLLQENEVTIHPSTDFELTVAIPSSNSNDEDLLGFDEINDEISLLSSVKRNDVDANDYKGKHLDAEVKAHLQVSNYSGECERSSVGLIVDKLKSSLHQQSPGLLKSNDEKQLKPDIGVGKLMGPVTFPWERDTINQSEHMHKRRNTEFAERTIPELELRRLRNVALRMKERMKVGAAGVTEAIVESIHDNWKESEVVKLKFEGPPSLNMKRIHEILERKTGGLVIWRSGSSLVLYRGMSYELPCVQTYSKLSNVESDQETTHSSYGAYCSTIGNTVHDVVSISATSNADNMTSFSNLLKGSMNIHEIDSLLDQLGPRFRDWSGRDPLPVDADLLPGVVPGYKPPYRLLPHKNRKSLRDREMTYFRRVARGMPPHFALGRNRQHQGLANAMVKLWEKSAIAKIAIKRGVPNTCNDRMAEEIKNLTGGVLLSRNKEYIVFYRGNDFLPTSIREALVERQKLACIQLDEEEQARLRASALVAFNARTAKGPLVAGTLQEFVKANTWWADQPSNEDREKMRRDSAQARHAGLVRYLERKLVFAQLKVKKAERALAKVHKFLKPKEVPTDLETVTDEERFLFRRMGLKMRSFLLVGRREVFDGTVQNMHLHWKHRELVKIIVRGKSFPQAKQIAISLEAESGGVLISLDKTTKGYAVILYRGKNYQRPHMLRPQNLLTKKQALARAIELQRREALNDHIFNLRERILLLKSQLNQMETGKELGNEMGFRTHDAFPTDNVEDEGEEAYLEIYNSDGEEDDTSTEYSGDTNDT